MILKMNFNFNFIRIAVGRGMRQRVKSPENVISITHRKLQAPQKTLRRFQLRKQLLFGPEFG